MSFMDLFTGLLCFVLSSTFFRLSRVFSPREERLQNLPWDIRMGLYLCGLLVLSRGFELIRLSGRGGASIISGHADWVALTATFIMVATFWRWSDHVAGHGYPKIARDVAEEILETSIRPHGLAMIRLHLRGALVWPPKAKKPLSKL